MAKMHLDRLRKKYKNIPVKGDTYQKLINQVIKFNTERIAKQTGRILSKDWEKKLQTFNTKEKTFTLPEVKDYFPNHSVFTKKAAESGELIRDKLKTKLDKDLRDSMKEFKTLTYQKGAKKGQIRTEVIDIFEKKITGTFDSYTKKDRRFGMPSNVHSIAVTEVRGTINNIKDNYIAIMMHKNPDLIVMKAWIQNKSLAKESRHGHGLVARRKPIPFDQLFEVPLYLKIQGRWIKVGTTLMAYPHDPSAPIEQNAGCNCDVIYIVKRRYKRKPKYNE